MECGIDHRLAVVQLPVYRIKGDFLHFSCKKIIETLAGSKKSRTFAAVKTKGSLAQLNRAFDYGSKGCGFESRRSHFGDLTDMMIMDGSLAQLNRAFDYGSKGCGFESRRSHKKGFASTRGKAFFVPFHRDSCFPSSPFLPIPSDIVQKRKMPGFTSFDVKPGIAHCGERGIRTPGASQHGGFQDRCNRPLYHLSKLSQRGFLCQKRCKGTTYF